MAGIGRYAGLSHGLSPDDLDVQARARMLADELIPYEVEAELNEGELDPAVLEKQHARVVELGLGADQHPGRARRPGADVPAAGARPGAGQPGHQRASAGSCTPRRCGSPRSPPTHQRERWLAPTVRGETHECYAITEEGAGSDVDAIEATARRDGDDYVLDGVKWHVTSYNGAAYCFFQAKLTEGAHAGEHAMFIVDLPSPGVRVVRTPAYSHTISHHHPIVAFEGVRVPADQMVGAEGDGMGFAYAWFRYERLMIAARCLGAMDRLRRGGARRSPRSGWCRAIRSSSSSRCRRCWRTASPSCSPRAR